MSLLLTNFLPPLPKSFLLGDRDGFHAGARLKHLRIILWQVVNEAMWIDSAYPCLGPPCCHRDHAAGHSIGRIVMLGTPLADAIFAAAASIPFKADQLSDEPLVIEQTNVARVEQGQEVEIQGVLGVGRLVCDSILAERLSNPGVRVSVAFNRGDAVALQQIGKLRDDDLR